MKKSYYLSILLVFVLFSVGCEKTQTKHLYPLLYDDYFEKGTASWYGADYQGKTTASGEIFDKNKVSAAHKELPFGTWVKVVNLNNGLTLKVRINDRGPYVEGRIIDLSERAAELLGMKTAGLAEVTITVVKDL